MNHTIIIKYLPNYIVKFTIRSSNVTECEGGGWYSVIGKIRICTSSRIKHLSQIPSKQTPIGELSDEDKAVFHSEKTAFENSHKHKEWLKTFNKIPNFKIT